MISPHKRVSVFFEDPQHNYTTSVNAKSSDESIKQYFEGTYFDVGVFPEENLQQCKRIEII